VSARRASRCCKEELGYIEGGSQTLVHALTKAISEQGGRPASHAAVNRVETNNKRVIGVMAAGEFFPGDAVISTVPTPYVGKLVPDLSGEERARYDAIANTAWCASCSG